MITRHRVSPGHAIFGKQHYMLGDGETLQDGDELGSLGQLLHPGNSALWSGASAAIVGRKVGEVARGDMVFRRPYPNEHKRLADAAFAFLEEYAPDEIGDGPAIFLKLTERLRSARRVQP